MSRGEAPEAARTPLISLDILRSLAAFMVLVVHTRSFSWVEFSQLPAAQRTAATGAFWIATRMGDEAVMVFFVLSGFLVGGRVLQRLRDDRFEIGAYAVDRATRILIPLVPACLFTTAIAAVVMHAPVSPFGLLCSMSGLNDVLAPTIEFNASLWSLPFEIWFYVLAGAAAQWASRGPGLLAGAALCAGALVFAQLGSTYLLFWSLGAMMVFAVGTARPAALFCVGALLLVLGVAIYELTVGSAARPVAPPDVGRALMCFGVCLALPLLCRPGLNRALAPLRGAAGFASAFSYSLYLFHYPVVMALDRVIPRSRQIDAAAIGLFLLRLAICVLVALAAYLLFERQTPRARRWLDARLRSGRGARPGPPGA
jgi:peptidoglycan/LPS O-acetylase OafA/YrhL